ncbi:MAG: precorrin-3B C(17)-methyltransferase [Lachnospiraceae bacterium]|nr:precorrin-3B C(17)-methyltransferase [Lachnospiraceae bacterium]
MKQLYVVGIGPGAYEKMTGEAVAALKKCEAIAGYQVYIDLVKADFPDKQWIVTGMMHEKERCELAFASADSDVTTAIVCSGDAGVYGMAGIVLELSVNYPEVEVCVVPGVTAALAGAAVLGAPLGHDFAVVSLSDLLTPWEVIEKRLLGAAMADFVICLYNPSSKKRADYLEKACRILMEYKSPQTKCGYVRQIGRDGEDYQLCTLAELEEKKVDMFTTVFVGNASTKIIANRLVTPRGYQI